MTNFSPGDIVLVDFPFVGDEQTKHRPALVLLDTGDADVLVARVTSQAHQSEFDVEIVTAQVVIARSDFCDEAAKRLKVL